MRSRMKTVYRYIRFEKKDEWLWACLNKSGGYPLGAVTYYEEWKQWVFEPWADTVHSASCLRDIAHFLEQLNKESK